MQDSDIFFLTNGNKTLTGVDELNCPTELNIPFGVTKIDKRALADCPAKRIFLPDTVTEIGYEAFSGSDALEFVHLPKNLESVGPAIFRGCFSLEKVEMGDSIPTFPESTFESCHSLKEIPFRSGIIELERNVFSECSSLESLVIPEGVALIRSGAMAYCKNLATVVLPSSIKIIEDDAFRDCENLAHIRFNGESPAFFIDEDTGCLFGRRDDGDLTLIKVPVNATEIRIPKKVSHAHSEAFQGCDSLKKVFIDCPLIDHPLFVALKTEIVNADIIDETQIEEVVSSQVAVDSEEEVVSSKVTVDSEEEVVSSQLTVDSEEEKPASKKAKKPRVVKQKVKASAKIIVEEPDTPEPDEPNTDGLVVEEVEVEVVSSQLAVVSEKEVEVVSSQVVVDSEEEVVSSQLTVDSEKEVEVEEETVVVAEEAAVQENDVPAETSTSTSIADDLLADILGQNVGAEETPEEEEEELKGITITIDELDAAMMRGIQEEEEKDCKVPEGFFPSNDEEEELPPQEPRFVNGMMSVSSTYEIIDEQALYPDRAQDELNAAAPIELEDITTLVVVTEEVTAENTISQRLKDFCVELARKRNLIRIYFFGALGLDNEEFLYGFGKFALYRNVIFATKDADMDSLSAEVKSFAEIAEINSPVTPFQKVVEENKLELDAPFKIFVQDNIQGNESSAPKEKAPAMQTLEGEGLLAKAEQIQQAQLGGHGLLQKAQNALEQL